MTGAAIPEGMELQVLFLPAGKYYALFTAEELAEIREINRRYGEVIRRRMEPWVSPDPTTPLPHIGPALEEAQLNNRRRRIEQTAIDRV